MAQKRRKNSVIVSFLCPISLLAEVDAAYKEQQKRTLKAPLSGRSEFIIRALKRDLAHGVRSRRKKQDGKVLETVATPRSEEGGSHPTAPEGDRGAGRELRVDTGLAARSSDPASAIIALEGQGVHAEGTAGAIKI